jgi:HPt (histidine-containing phosphotransfer) domain-containing protein
MPHGDSTTTPGNEPFVLDREALLEQFGGDSKILTQVTEMFLTQYRGQLAAIGESLAAPDPAALARSAHKLKGSVGIFGSDGAVQAAAALERQGAAGRLEDAQATYDRLTRELERLREALQQLLADLGR